MNGNPSEYGSARDRCDNPPVVVEMIPQSAGHWRLVILRNYSCSFFALHPLLEIRLQRESVWLRSSPSKSA